MVALSRLCWALAFIVLSGATDAALAASGEPEEHVVNTRGGQSFMVNPCFKYMGSFSEGVYISTETVALRHAVATAHEKLFVKTFPGTKVVAELVGIRRVLLPSKWGMKSYGAMPDRYSPALDLSKMKNISVWLREKGYETRGLYSFGQYMTEQESSQSGQMYFIVSHDILPPKVKSPDLALKAWFQKRVVPLESASPVCQCEPSDAGGVASPAQKHVALVYSKEKGVVFTARSASSIADAKARAQADCGAPDCMAVVVTNSDGCVAFAKDEAGRWGKARGGNANDAREMAQMFCSYISKSVTCAPIADICPE